MILLNNEKYFNNLKGCFSGFVNDTTGDAEQQESKDTDGIRVISRRYNYECCNIDRSRTDGFCAYFSTFENGHEVRLVGSPLDDAVIDRLREDNYHVNLRRTLHDGINYIKCADVKEAIKEQI